MVSFFGRHLGVIYKFSDLRREDVRKVRSGDYVFLITSKPDCIKFVYDGNRNAWLKQYHLKVVL